MFESLKFNWRPHKWAILYCAIAAIGALCYGYDNTYYNGVLAMQQFKDDYGTRYVDGQKALPSSFQALTASSIYIGDLLGAIIAAPINDRWGRKAVFWFASFCILVGGIAQVADTNHEAVITVGRILMGLGVGQFTVTSLLYMGEMAPSEIRGPVLMMFQFLQSWAQLIASALTQGTENISSSLSYKLPMGGLIILPLAMAVALPFIPESPLWYIMKGKRNDAETSLRKIHRGHVSYDPFTDLAMLEETKRAEEEHAHMSTWKSLLIDPIERRKVLYSAGAMFSQQICGTLFFYVYGVVFAQEIGIEEPFLIQLITNILQIFAVGASVLTGNKVRRRLNLIVTNCMMLFAFIVIGGIGTQRTLTTASQYVIVIFSFIVIIGFNYGPGPLAYTIAREMAVGINQNKIMSTSIVVFYFTTWVVSFTAPYLYYDAGLGPMLGFVYAGTTCIALTWTWFCVGETAGRTNLEIALFFTERVSVRKWRTHVFAAVTPLGLQEKADSDMNRDQCKRENVLTEHREATSI
jgi:sugar porter (SP) family MFS transporter